MADKLVEAMYDEEFDKLVKEAEEWTKKNAKERAKKMKEVEDLAKGKAAPVSGKHLQEIVNDQLHQRITKLSLKEVIVFSGQGRPATQREIQDAVRK